MNYKIINLIFYFYFYKQSAIDTSNFDEEFTSETPKDSYVNEHITDIEQQAFIGFTFNPTHDGVMSRSMANSVQDI